MDISNRLQSANARRRSVDYQIRLRGVVSETGQAGFVHRGGTLGAEITVGDRPLAGGSVSFSWYVAPGDRIAGADGATLFLGDTVADMATLYCVAKLPNGTLIESERVLLREVPPTTLHEMPDEIFDLGSGNQLIRCADAFSGRDLTFACHGGDAWIDAVSGVLTVRTDTVVDAGVIMVSARNSGGMSELSVPYVVEAAGQAESIPFGALTPDGYGGLDVDGSSIVSGDLAGHWRLRRGRLYPSGAGALNGHYTLTLDTGVVVEIEIVEGKASARADEIVDVFQRLPSTAAGLLVHDGDVRDLGRIRLPARVFDGEFVMEPTRWVEDPDPKASTRPVILAGLTIGGDPSGDGLLRMENLTVQGFQFQMEQSLFERESNNGIVLVERPSRHITLRQNEIWSRPLREILLEDDFRNNIQTSRQMRGIATKVYRGRNEHIRIEENHIHDVSRGASLVATDAYQGLRSRLCENIIEDCYTNFFTCGYLDGLDIFDNRCIGIHAAKRDTLGAIPKTSPHAATGGSFDAGGSKTTRNVTMMGNLFHVGWARTKLHEDMGLPKPQISATGVKFNDPNAADSYWNLIVAFNTIISHGICLEISGAGADTHTLVFNNTLAMEGYAGTGSVPIIYFAGVDRLRCFNNIAPGYAIGKSDGTEFYVETLKNFEGYGNLKINGVNGAFGTLDYFQGHATKGFDLLSPDEAMEAYVPRAETYAMTAPQRKGALGTESYFGNGAHSITFDVPVAALGPSEQLPLTYWAGDAYLDYVGDGGMTGFAGRESAMLFAWEGALGPSMDGKEATFLGVKRGRMSIAKTASGRIEVIVDNGDEGVALRAFSRFKIREEDGLCRFAVSYDMDQGRVLFAKNGEVDGYPSVRSLGRGRLPARSNLIRLLADDSRGGGRRVTGALARLYWSPEFLDLETQEGMDRLFTADGGFRPFGKDGSQVTSNRPLIYVHGDAETVQNYGIGGAFKVVGQITDLKL